MDEHAPDFLNAPLADPSKAHYYVERYRAAGRSLDVVRAWMAARSRYFAALGELSERLGVVDPVYVSVADEVVGFELPKDAKVPKGYLRDNKQGRARGAVGPINPTRVFPSNSDEKKALRTLFGRLGRRATGEILNRGLVGSGGPFRIKVHPIGEAVCHSYQLQAEEGGDGWWIYVPRGLPVPYDAVRAGSHVEYPGEDAARASFNPAIFAAAGVAGQGAGFPR